MVSACAVEARRSKTVNSIENSFICWRRELPARAVSDREAAAAAKGMVADLQNRGGLPAFELALEHHVQNSALDFRLRRMKADGKSFHGGIQFVIRRQTVLVFLILAQFGRRRSRQDALGNELLFGVVI